MALAITASLKPLPPSQFGYAQARHLLNRAGFGGTPQQIVQLQMLGLDAAVDYLVDYDKVDDAALPDPTVDPDLIAPLTTEERILALQARRNNDQQALEQLRLKRVEREARDRSQMADLRRWWLARMVSTPRPLQEKLTLLWHGHFASNHRTVQDSFLMLQQNQMFRSHAHGSFARLAAGIVRDPAMIKFLNNDSNVKRRPNENLARELMELFTLGVGNYTEDDIKQGARALTGYGVEDDEFVFRSRQHDGGAKNIFGQRDHFNGDDFVQLCLTRKSCPEFVGLKLYKHFVADLDQEPDATAGSVISNLAAQLIQRRYQIAPVLKTLFRSEHFYDPGIMGNMIKSPTQVLVGTIRMLNTPVRNMDTLTDAMTMMGQRLFEPPTVAGWDGGRSWINTSTLFARQNLATYLITGRLPFASGWSAEQVQYDPMFLLADLPVRSAQAVIEHLTATVLGENIHQSRRAELARFLSDRGRINSDTIIGTLLLLTAMPEYQLC